MQHAKQLAAQKDDPWLLGHFSDNELPLWRTSLRGYLKFPAADHGHQAAQKWLRERHGADATVAQITEQDEKRFPRLCGGSLFPNRLLGHQEA